MLDHAVNSLRAVKNADGTTTITGRAIVFNQPSQPLPFIEYIDSGALDGVDLSKLLLLYAHDYDNVLSRTDAGTLTTKLDENGLTFTATLPDTTLANDVRENINAGNLQGCSFGFNLPTDGSGETWSTRSDGVQIHHVTHIASVSELTITPIPAYTQTSVQVQRDLQEYLRSKGEKKTMETQNSSVAASSAENEREASTVATSSAENIDEIIKRAVDSAVASATDALKSDDQRACGPKSKKRDDDDVDDSGVDNSDADVDTAEEDDAQPKSSAASSAASSTDSSSASSVSATSSASTRAIDNIKEDNEDMIDITPNSKTKNEEITRDFKNYLLTRELTGELKRDTANVGLPTGSVLIPKTIMPVEHEQHQFPRLGSLVHNVSVSTTTGVVPVFQTTDQKLVTKAEFDHAAEASAKLIKEISWKLQSYGSKFTTSRDLLMDSSYNWIAELQQTLGDLKGNTDDSLIATALTTNATNKITATDAIADIKKALNVNLKPVDARNAQIILSQSAYNALDQLKDGFGRPLLQPDPTNATSNRLFGKTVITVDDNLLGKAGEANVVVTPLNRSIYSFNEGQVSGQFLDDFDVFDVVLGVFVRKDVEVARPDLITTIKLTDKSVAASDGGSLGK